jgi:hypothetical protein
VSRARWSALAAAVALACGGTDEPLLAPSPFAGPPGELSAEMLRADVQPTFDRLCAQTACHGVAEHGLFLYSTHGTRMGSSLTALTDDELDANLDTCRAYVRDLDEVTTSLLLSRPLRVDEGGTLHGGGDQFYDRTDPGYVLITCWLLGGTWEGLQCEL